MTSLTLAETNFINNAPFLVGIDEAGAGTLAGDLVVAGCILKPNHTIVGLSDSKKLSESKREALFDIIIDQALAFHIIHISPVDVDKFNILNRRMFGMRECIKNLHQATHAIVDGDRIPLHTTIPTISIIKGDDKVDCVRAASILAKVSHDRSLIREGAAYPNFKFSSHKGYGTQLHKEELEKFGPTPLHRLSYKPVKLSAIKHGIALPSWI